MLDYLVIAHSVFRLANELADEVLARLRHFVLWNLQIFLVIQYFMVGFPPRIASERRVAEQTLEQNAARGPEITFLGIALLPQNLYCRIILRSDGTKCLQATVL